MCLPEFGNYIFTIYDAGGDPSVAGGTYFIFLYGNTMLHSADLDFGASESTPFTLGDKSMTNKNTNAPTKSPARSNPIDFWPF